MTFRVGGHWGTTIVREGAGEPDEHGRRLGDELVAVVVNGDRDLAASIVEALNHRQPGVLIQMPKDLTPAQFEAFVDAWRRVAGSTPALRLDPSLIFREGQ